MFKYEEKVQELTRLLTETTEKNEDSTYRLNNLTEKHDALTEKFDLTERKLKEETTSKVKEI